MTKSGHCRALAVGVMMAVLVMTPAPAWAGELENKAQWCADTNSGPARRIAACTWLLNSGRLSQDDYPVAYANRGLAHGAAGQYDRAIADFSEAIRLLPEHAVAFHSRGLSYYFKGQYGQAIKDFNQAIRLQPDYGEAFNMLAWLLATGSAAQVRNGERAVALAKRAIELKNVAEFFDTLAAAHARAGQFAEARDAQQWAIAKLRAKGGSAAALADMQSRLALYRRGQPFTDE